MLTLATMVVCLVVSTVIVLRRSDDRMALIVALMLVTLGPFTMSETVPASPSHWQVPLECLSFLFVTLFLSQDSGVAIVLSTLAIAALF